MSAMVKILILQNRFVFHYNSVIVFREVKEILLKIGFIEEMVQVIARGDKKCAPNFVPQFPLSTKIDLVRLTFYHWQPCV